MSCCGNRRAAARRPVGIDRPHPVSIAPPPAVDDAAEPRSGIAVEYRGRAPTLYRATDGRLYAFSPERRLRRLPRSEGQLLLRSPLFRLEAQ